MNPDDLYQSVVEQYSHHINPGLARLMSFAGFGVEMSAEGCYITDHEGRKFLDCLGGYGCFSLGHRHPKVIQAVKDQLDRMPLSGKAFFSKPTAELAAKLTSVAPKGLDYVFLSNTGTEAVEAALKFAKATTKRAKIVATEGSYHGKTIGALSVTGREKYRHPFTPLMPGAEYVPYGDGSAAADAIDDKTACFIVEPVQGEGGIIIPPDGYLKQVRDACDRAGALLIFDEVQTGLGRTGTLFGCQREGVSPDLMTLAKALGGGVMPIGATLGTATIWDSVFTENPLAHTSTFGGNPLACAAALATLDVLEEEGLVERSRNLGEVLKSGMMGIQKQHEHLVAEVRGRGLMVGIEFAMDEVGELVVSQLLKREVCVAYALNNPRVLRFEPPLTISEAQIKTILTALDEAISETSAILSELIEV
jgi:putrescine aminotransferase